MSKWQYIVWVGGTDDYYVTFEDAQRAYDEWLDKGYDDVIIEKIKISGRSSHWCPSCQK